jgi:hypothetical protein
VVFQIYADRKVLASALHYQLAAIDFTVLEDSSRQLPGGLSLAIDVRVAGTATTQPFKQPLVDGAIGGKISIDLAHTTIVAPLRPAQG